MRLVSLTGTSPRQGMAETQPRYICHFVPTSSSWLNLVEQWFAIDEFLAAWNENPKPFLWTATVSADPGKASVRLHSTALQENLSRVCWKADPYGNPLADLDESDPV